MNQAEPVPPEDGLLIKCDKITLDEHRNQIPVSPQLLQINIKPAGLGLDDHIPLSLAYSCCLFLFHNIIVYVLPEN
ncbi:MAG: hypothetical protein D3915_16110 [Candidatus Electrothrix sp. AU1_5]|nr:hypothetical protein [Candidatus Electrothrix gigas]